MGGEASEARLDVAADQIARWKDGECLYFVVNRTGKPIDLPAGGAWFDPVSGRVTRPPRRLEPTQSGFLMPGASAEGTPDGYDFARFEPAATWARLLEEDNRHPQDVDYAPAPLPEGGNMMLSYPAWFEQGLDARPTERKYFSTWSYAPAT